MTFQPFIDASVAIQFHASSALFAFMLGAFLLTRKKGDRLHRFSGYIWVGAMITAISTSWLIGEIGTWGHFSYIHILSAWATVSLFFNVRAARMGNIRAHAAGMKGLYFGGLIVAGTLAFAPGRVLNEMMFGNAGGNAGELGFYTILTISGLTVAGFWLQTRRKKMLA